MKEVYNKRHVVTVEQMLEQFDEIDKEYEGELSFPEFRDHVVNGLKVSLVC